MKTKTLKFIALASMAAGILMFAVSSVGAKGASTGRAVQEGGVEVETTSVSVTIMGVNYAQHTLTLSMPGGLKTFKVSKEVANFDQIRAYDKVKVTLVEALAVFLRKSSDPASAGETEMVALAPKGALPGVVMADAKEVTAKITSLNRKNRTATLLFVDGEKRVVKVNRSVDLSGVRVGDNVTARLTEALAIVVEKP